MILGPVSLLDCAVFCLFLAPALLWRVGIVRTSWCVIQTLPFLREPPFCQSTSCVFSDYVVIFRSAYFSLLEVVTLPVQFLSDHLLATPRQRSPFVRQASLFEDFVIRCVRYAFANIPAAVGRVFFSKEVALPFLRWRMLRHGYIKSPIHWREYRDRHFRGIWMIRDPVAPPSVVIYYLHGGGFSMGSPFFYLEFLLAWVSVLTDEGYENPAIFALDYDLVPDASFPTQLHQTVFGYRHVLAVAKDPSIVTVSGDSAGAMLVLSLLLAIGREAMEERGVSLPASARVPGARSLPKPALAVLISPWVALLSPKHENTWSDYLDAGQIEKYGLQYAGRDTLSDDPLASPGDCTDLRWWKAASPAKGWFIAYGNEEMFAPVVKELVKTLRRAEVPTSDQGQVGGIHAWPVASLFLASTEEKRLAGLRSLAKHVRESVAPKEGTKKIA